MTFSLLIQRHNNSKLKPGTLYIEGSYMTITGWHIDGSKSPTKIDLRCSNIMCNNRIHGTVGIVIQGTATCTIHGNKMLPHISNKKQYGYYIRED